MDGRKRYPAVPSPGGSVDHVRTTIIQGFLMRLPKRVANPGLAALVEGAGFQSWERFAQAINRRGWDMHGVKLFYDHISVKRWLSGSVCQNPDVVAAVLGEAWGVPIPDQVIWPSLRDGQAPIPAQLQVWVAERTLEDLGAFIGSDMLSRREVLAGSVSMAAGETMVGPLARWLGMDAVGLPVRPGAPQRVGPDDVANIEQSTRHFAATDAKVGGSLSREAAVGQLKYTVDLVRYGSYSEAVGHRLLAAVAGLAGLVGWMCLDSDMAGPAQQYLTYGLQAARESNDPRAPLLAVHILGDLGQQSRWCGEYITAVRLFDLALAQLPAGRNRFNLTRAILTGNRAQALAYLGRSGLPEVRGALGMAADLRADAGDEERELLAGLAGRSVDVSEPELAEKASQAYLTLAADDRRLAEEAEERAMHALTHLDPRYGRNRLLTQIRLSRIRFVAGEPERACDDGERALTMADPAASWMARKRLSELLTDTEPYRERPRVRELRERLQELVSG
jgi:hypothetical protein